MPIPTGISREDVLGALQSLDSGVSHPFKPARKYVMVHDGNRYPPKAVIGLAARRLLGRTLLPREFSGGQGDRHANDALRELGFAIHHKDDLPPNPRQLDGYALVADPEWLEIHASHSVGQAIVYSRGSGAPIRNLPQGALIFCMKKGEMPRHVHLWGRFRDSPIHTPEEVWDTYRPMLGGVDRRTYLEGVADLRGPDGRIAAVILDAVVVPPTPVPLEAAGVAIPRAAVKGKGLTPAQVRDILDLEANTTYADEFGDQVDGSDAEAAEGARRRRTHVVIERNPAIAKRARDRRLARDPELKCDACGTSFLATYGEVGRGFIEAHHKTPLSELDPPISTRVSDFELLCANCHRMIHRGKMTLRELREMLKAVRRAL